MLMLERTDALDELIVDFAREIGPAAAASCRDEPS